MTTPKPMPREAVFLDFAACVCERMHKGQLKYGDRSFSARPSQLIRELEQEALDLAGWGYILWCRLRQMQAALERAANVSKEIP